mgnify:CR=1 FL=1
MTLLQLLLESKATVDIADRDGRTALYWASHGGHVDVARTLIEAGSDVNACGRDGQTALMVAAEVRA